MISDRPVICKSLKSLTIKVTWASLLHSQLNCWCTAKDETLCNNDTLASSWTFLTWLDVAMRFWPHYRMNPAFIHFCFLLGLLVLLSLPVEYSKLLIYLLLMCFFFFDLSFLILICKLNDWPPSHVLTLLWTSNWKFQQLTDQNLEIKCRPWNYRRIGHNWPWNHLPINRSITSEPLKMRYYV